MSIPGVPSDNTTLVSALGRFRAIGYDVDFVTRPGAAVQCGACGSKSPAGSMHLDGVGRLEGASDPDDSVAILALRCPVCDRAGTAVAHFGPMSSDEDLDLLTMLETARLPDDAD